jgi:hypothetical protein
MTKTRPPIGASRSLRCLRLVLAWGLVLSGCALDEAADDATDLAQVTDLVAMDASSASIDASSPADAGARDAWRPADPATPRYPADYPAELPRIVDVRPNGSGCPTGTVWSAISRDGTALTITFGEFEAVLSRTNRLAVKDCQIGISIKSTDGYALTLESAVATSYAYLERGVTGTHLLKAYAAGTPIMQMDNRTALTGPFDNSYVVEQTEPFTLPCGRERHVTVVNRLQLRRDTDAGAGVEGYMNMSALGILRSGVRLKISWRRCA